MREIRTLGPWLRRFFGEYLVTERNLSPNTRASYRDAFVLLLQFISAKLKKPVDRLHVRDISSQCVRDFLKYLEADRGCSVHTRNQRLAAIRCFGRFVGSRDPAYVEWCAHIRAISVKKTQPKHPSPLTKDEMKAVLNVPDRTKRQGRVEYALLLFSYNTGARVSEVTGLIVRDLELDFRGGHDSFVTLHGKGGKTRECPLWPETVEELAELVSGRADGDTVFLSRYGTPFSRSGVYRLVKRCGARVPALAGKTVTPHVLRHTTAIMLLRAGVDIATISSWLGHASVDTTNIYLEIDKEMMSEALALCDIDEPDRPQPSEVGKGLMDYLSSLQTP